jgi:rhamnogalacturonan endolyase
VDVDAGSAGGVQGEESAVRAQGAPHELNAGDSISFFDLSAKGRRTEILLKDRYRFFWVYDADLKPLWNGGGRLGHFPYACDTNGDGKDEVFIGYAMWTSDGKQLWTNDVMLNDHADGLIVGSFDPKAEPRVYAVGSDEGFVVFNLKGEVLKHQRVGHTQNMTVAKLRPDLPGLQIATINFWKNPGILTAFDADGNMLTQGEPHHCGSMILPVKWRGDGQDFLLLSGDVKQGGMLDGHLRRAVMFPDDGHPDLAATVLNVTGDERDEIILWVAGRVWAYPQDRPAPGPKRYVPERNPLYNDSNYRSMVSVPRWK